MRFHGAISVLLILSANKIRASGPEHEAILNWWLNEASVQRPLKCTVDPSYKVESHKLNSLLPTVTPVEKIVKSFACEEGQDGSVFDFKGSGKVVDGVLQGPGKLKMYYKHTEEAMYGGPNGTKSCISYSTKNGASPDEVIGTFKDGLLEGMSERGWQL